MEVTTESRAPLVPPQPPTPPQPHRPWYRRWWGMLLTGLFLAFILIVLVQAFLLPAENSTSDEGVLESGRFSDSGEQADVISIDQTRFVRDLDHSLGATDSPIVIVEFADFECPFCKEAYPTIRGLSVEFGDKIHYVFRHFPLTSIHEHAMAAAEASECAREQGKFWPYHDRLYQNQDRLDDASLVEYARAVGVETGEFEKCVSEHRYRFIIDRDIADGRALGVTGTPTWFINGNRRQGVLDPTQFHRAIELLIEHFFPQS